MNHEERREAALAHLRRYPHLKLTAFETARVLGSGRPSAGRWMDALASLADDGLITRIRDTSTYPPRIMWQAKQEGSETCQNQPGTT
jgi:DNA-binding PadR family transcriptional regulator